MPFRQRLGQFLLGLLVVATAAALAQSYGLPVGQTGEARLVAFEQLPDYSEGICEWEVAVPQAPSYAAAGAAMAQLPPANARLAVTGRKPLHFIQDPYPSFSSVAVDPVRNEVVLTDENRFRIMVYDRLATTPASAEQTEPKRVIGGLHSHTQYASDSYIDGPTGDIYIINNDTVHNATVFTRDQNGDVEPDREFNVMAGGFGVAVDESRQELYITEQRESAITVWKKSSAWGDTAVRLIQGERTQLADPHGIAFDPKNRLLYVANYGTSHVVRKLPDGSPNADYQSAVPILNWPGSAGGSEIVPGSGKFGWPSITVYSADIEGDVAPLRVIEGRENTGLNRPTGVAFDAERGELYVADEVANTVSVFSADAEGDVAPIRVLEGPRTLMRNPSDVFLDHVNNEMWVASFGNHLALAYELGAEGDTAPGRIIRGSPLNTPGSMISNPYAVAYDTKRQEILVTSCVGQSAHHRIRQERRRERAARALDSRCKHVYESHDACHRLRRAPRRDCGAVAGRSGDHDVPRGCGRR